MVGSGNVERMQKRTRFDDEFRSNSKKNKKNNKKQTQKRQYPQ